MEQIAFGIKLTEIRTTKGLTQGELAKKCKISMRTIQRIESGAVKPQAFTIRAISEVLEIDFFDASNYTDEDAKKDHRSNTKWYSSLLWHIKDLFNLRTNTVKKLSILSVVVCITTLGLLSIADNLSAQKTETQKVKASDYSKFQIFNGGGFYYKFPKGELGLSGVFDDTVCYFLEKGLIQESKNNIFLNRSFVGKAFKGDTVIYNNRKVNIKPPYKFQVSSFHGINYKFKKDDDIKWYSTINDTTYFFLKKDSISMYKNNVYLNQSFVGKAIVGDTIIYRSREVFIKSTNAKFVNFKVFGIYYKYPYGELEMSSRINDTTYHFLKKDLIQEFKSNIFLNRSFVGKALVGDTVIYRNRKVIIKSACSK